jgi:hypothetical protein
MHAQLRPSSTWTPRRRAFQSLSARLRRRRRLDFELRLPGVAIHEPVASLFWLGRPDYVQFDVWLPPDTREGTVIATLDVSMDSAPVGHVKFKLAIDRQAGKTALEPQGEHARRYAAAFISYASADPQRGPRACRCSASQASAISRTC